MVSLGITSSALFRRGVWNSHSFSEGKLGYFPAATPSSRNALFCSVRYGRSDWPVHANARQWAQLNAQTDSKKGLQMTAFPAYVDSGTISGFPTALEGNESAFAEHCQELLRRSGLADIRAREAFAVSGEITEAHLERLVESLLLEAGQSKEDYEQRAILFQKVGEFFSQGRAYSPPSDGDSWASSAEIVKTMQGVVDVVLAEEGRSATDYDCRAQWFAKSAEVFPFASESRPS